MNEQDNQLHEMINYLLDENGTQTALDQRSSRFQGLRYEHTDQLALPDKPWTKEDLRYIWRGLINRREPAPIEDNYLTLEDAYLESVKTDRPVVSLKDISAQYAPLYLWQGDITQLNVDAIVNAANSEMLGCFIPNHHCVDNQIHTFAGVRLRLDLNEQMRHLGRKEPVGKARMTQGYHLPAKYIFHTVGPVITGQVNKIKEQQLKNCYMSCLKLADEMNLETIAFSSISTGQFGYPPQEAAKVAYKTVQNYLKQTNSKIQVIFCVYDETSRGIYEELLQEELYE